MSQEEEGVCQVSGEPRGRAGESEQNPHRGTQSPQRLVLPQIRVKKTKRKKEKGHRIPGGRGGAQWAMPPYPSPCTETQHRAMHPDAATPPPPPPFSTILLSF